MSDLLAHYVLKKIRITKQIMKMTQYMNLLYARTRGELL